MSEGVNGYGPAGPRYSHQLFVHEVRPSNVGTELTVILDDGGEVSRLLVAFPPTDQEWRTKFLTVLDPGPPPLRSATILTPPGTPIVSFRCVDAQGDPISYLCCMYRLVQGDWLDDVAPSQMAVPELLGDEEAKAEQQEMEQRLYVESGGSTCCICGNIVPSDKGYRFKQLSDEAVRAIRLESALARDFPFICFGCYQRKLGNLSVQAMGSVSALEGRFAHFLLVFLRGYILAILYWNMSARPDPQSLMFAAFLGAFVPFERVPAICFQAMKNPAILLVVVFLPVMLALFAGVRSDITFAIFQNPSQAWYLLGLHRTRLIHFGVVKSSVWGSLAGLLVGAVFGFMSGSDDEED